MEPREARHKITTVCSALCAAEGQWSNGTEQPNTEGATHAQIGGGEGTSTQCCRLLEIHSIYCIIPSHRPAMRRKAGPKSNNCLVSLSPTQWSSQRVYCVWFACDWVPRLD